MVGGSVGVFLFVPTNDIWIFDINNKSWKELVGIALYCWCGLHILGEVYDFV